MSSIIRPTPAQTTRRLVVLGATLLAIVVTYGQLLSGWGQSEEQLSAQGNQTLEVAGYAFSIWGLIYAGLLAYAIRQALPQTGESRLINRTGWPSALAFLAMIGRVISSAMDWKWATVVLILAQLMLFLGPLVADAAEVRSLSMRDRDRWLTVWPLAAVSGWLTVAAPLNLVTVLTATGTLPPGGPTLWALVTVAVVVAIALAVLARIRTLAYALPIVWGLVGAFVAEQAGNPFVAFAALIAAGVVLVGAVVLTFRLRPGVERAA